MVAAVRGQASRGARAPARAPARASASAARGAGSKFHAAEGIPPRLALMVAGGALVLALGVFLFTGNRLQQAGQAIGHGVAGQMAAFGFSLQSLKISGASPIAAADIAAASELSKGQPVFDIDLDVLRGRVAAVGWVQDVTVRRLLPATIEIRVVERPPVAVWQSGGVLRVIDRDGRVIPEADPGRFPSLPLVVGQGANESSEEILKLVAARPRLSERLEAVVRVDDRRWDLRLKDGAIILLPATDEESALIRLDYMDQNQRLLELGFERIDLRSDEMVVVRRRSAPLPGQLLAGGV